MNFYIIHFCIKNAFDMTGDYKYYWYSFSFTQLAPFSINIDVKKPALTLTPPV